MTGMGECPLADLMSLRSKLRKTQKRCILALSPDKAHRQNPRLRWYQPRARRFASATTAAFISTNLPRPAILRSRLVSVNVTLRLTIDRNRAMETVTLSTKGQLVIPASVRGALHLKPGNRLNVSIQGGNIVLKPESAKAWKPINPAGVSLSAAQLCKPVDLSNEAGRR
jgi:AbrB family looped-hinge helix DNA binding protein